MPARLIIAHRGHKVGAPEQTMEAYEQAIRFGATMLEVDLRFSRDGVALLLHDASLDRTTSGAGPVNEMDWADIQKLDAGGWFSPEFSGVRVPSLDELFEFAGRQNIRLCIEAKGQNAREHLAAAQYAATEIVRRGRLDEDVVASFDHRALARTATEFPGLATAPDRLPERGRSSAHELMEQARSASARIIQHHFADLDPETVAEVQSEGFEVWAWPPANREEALFAYRTGAIGLMGDDVKAISDVVADESD